jgi:hypothetical protein
MRAAFTPGSYWTADRKTASFEAMVITRDTPEMRAVMKAIADMAVESDPAAAAAAAAGTLEVLPALAEGLSRDRCIYRRGRRDDAPQLASLIVSGELPPFFRSPTLTAFLSSSTRGASSGPGVLSSMARTL